jgi:hypothetical protein
MVLSFLIASLIIFIINLTFSLVSVAASAPNNGINIYQITTIFVILIMMTWNIFAIVSL